MEIFILFIIIIIFYFYFRRRKNNKLIGTLRLDTSDDTPYLFLELEEGGMDKIKKNKFVVLKVSLENYISRE